MEHAHGLAPCEQQTLVKLLAWHAWADELYPSAEAPDALLRPPTGPDAEAHLARSVRIVLDRARQAAGGAEAAAPASATAERDLAIAGDCAKLLSKQWGPAAYEGMVSDWADAPPSKSFPTVPAPFLEMALCNADLRQADLRGKNLTGLDLSSLCLVGANLRGCDIGGASFKNADLSRANLGNAQANSAVDFTGANLQGANLASAWCRADYTNANLRDAILSEVKGSANLDGADLTGVDVSICYWSVKSAKGAILHGAVLPLPFDAYNWKWGEMDLAGAQVTTYVSERHLQSLRDQDYRDSWLNHVENRSASRLNNIASIADPAVRVQMMRVLIEALAQVAAEGVSLSSNLTSLNDVLLRGPHYLSDSSIRGFVDTHLGPALLDKAASGQLPWAAGADAQRSLDHPVAVKYGLNHARATLLSAPDETPAMQSATLARLAAPINQLLAAAQRHPSCARAALLLRHAWIEQLDQHFPGLRPVVEEQSFLEPLQAGNYVEVSRDGQQALAYEQPYMDRIEGREGVERVSWGSAYRFEARPEAAHAWEFAGGLGEQGRVLTADLQPFPWIQSRYIALNSDEIRAALLQTALGSVGTAPEGDLRELMAFLAQAVQSKSQPATASRPWLSRAGQAKLDRIFAPLLQPADTADAGVVSLSDQTRFTPAHERTVLDQIGHACDVADPQAQARYVLSVGHVFVHLSSSAIMGTASDSPNAVRAAAVACLNLAHELDPTLLAEQAYGSQASVRQDWVDRLCGKKFSCTAILSNAMSDFVRAHPSDGDLTQAHAQVLPQAWR
jgi:uncharacterized protein YjbI with pentapeptide repeats